MKKRAGIRSSDSTVLGREREGARSRFAPRPFGTRPKQVETPSEAADSQGLFAAYLQRRRSVADCRDLGSFSDPRAFEVPIQRETEVGSVTSESLQPNPQIGLEQAQPPPFFAGTDVPTLVSNEFARAIQQPLGSGC